MRYNKTPLSNSQRAERSDDYLTTVYEVWPRKDNRGFDLISDALPYGRLRYGEPNAISNAIGYAKHRSPSQNAVIRVYDDAGNVIETHEHAGAAAIAFPHLDFPCVLPARRSAYKNELDRAPLEIKLLAEMNGNDQKPIFDCVVLCQHLDNPQFTSSSV